MVYQAYRPAIGRYAATHGRFGGQFSFGRMSWIKPNFLWMMYRSGWGEKPGQEITLAVSLAREGFDQILRDAVHAGYVETIYGERERWQRRAGDRRHLRLRRRAARTPRRARRVSPRERVYPVRDPEVAAKLGLD